MRLHRRILAVAVAAALALTACAAFEPAAAVVGTRKIENDAFVRKLELVLDPGFGQQAPGADPAQQRRELIHQLLTFLIQQQVVDERAEEEGIEVPEERIDDLLGQQIEQVGGKEQLGEILDRTGATIVDLRDLLRAQIVRDQVAQAVVETEVTEEDLRAAYEDRIREFTSVHAAHILVRSQALARRIADRVTKRTFAELAARFSQDPGSAEDGGDLGTHPITDFVEPFANAALEIPVGQIAGPVESEFGFHIIWVKERDRVPFAQVRDRLLGERAPQVFSDWLLRSLRSTTVRVNPRYGIFDPASGQVVERTATSPPPRPGPQITP